MTPHDTVYDLGCGDGRIVITAASRYRAGGAGIDLNQRLRPQLWKQLKVGSRVVSHAFDMGAAWPPDRTVDVEGRTIYGWTIRERHKRAVA